MNLLSQAGARIRKSPAIIFIFVVIVVALVISIGTTVEDYSTSRMGYMELPTRKINTWVIPLVAALPQVLQILMAYAFMTDTKRGGWALGIAGFAHVVDVGLDVFYKSGGEWALVPLSIVETELVYTFGSEFLLAFSFGLILETFPDFLRQVNVVLGNIVEAIREVMPNAEPGPRQSPYRPPQPNQQKMPNPPKFQQPMKGPAPRPDRGEDERRW